MTSTARITLHIGNAIPHGNEKDSARIIGLWQTINDFFDQRQFTSLAGIRSQARTYRISLEAGSLVSAMENARDQSQSFTNYRKAHVDDPQRAIDAELAFTLSRDEGELDELESYQVITVFLQQLVLAVHLVEPGAIQILDARFTGPGSHRYEAQTFDSKIFYGALKTAQANNWPELQEQSFARVWEWLEGCEASHTHTAIKEINRVLFTLLKVAEQRHEASARTVLLIMYQLETLLECRNARSVQRIRNRARLVLGRIPEAADCFKELYEVRNSLFVASQPVHRPLLICHNTAEELKEQIGQHDTAVELGTVITLALLHDLIAHQAREFDFTETVSRR